MPLLHDCLNAYLSPLLKKHSFGGVLTYDDLATSLEQAKAILGTPPNPIVMVCTTDLVMYVYEFDCFYISEKMDGLMAGVAAEMTTYYCRIYHIQLTL